MKEKGKDSEIRSMGKLSRTAVKIAEANGLGLLKTSWGAYKIIRTCGLGAYTDSLEDLASVDEYLKNLEKHKASRL